MQTPSQPLSLFKTWVVALMVLTVTPSFATSLNISQTFFRLTENTSIATFKLTNESKTATQVQITAFEWQQAENKDKLLPTNRFLIMPRKVTLSPSETRLLRIAYRGDWPDHIEGTYRLLVQELAMPESIDESGFKLSLQLSLPIFVAPKAPIQENLQWALQGQQLTLHNHSNKTVFFDSLQLVDCSNHPLSTLKTFSYILPKQSQFWTLTPETKIADCTRIVANGRGQSHESVVQHAQP